MLFKHFVGKSTLKEGLTISRDFEGWFESPEKGCKRQIKLIFDDNKEVFATLRRLNNAVGHVQIKYETPMLSPRLVFSYFLRIFITSRFSSYPPGRDIHLFAVFGRTMADSVLG